MTVSDERLPDRRESEQQRGRPDGLRMVAALDSGVNHGPTCVRPNAELAVSLEGTNGLLSDMSPHEPAQEAAAPSQLAKGAVSLASRGGDLGSLSSKQGAGPACEGQAQPREAAEPRLELPGPAAPPLADALAVRQQHPEEAAAPNGLAQLLLGGQSQQREPPQVQEPAAEAAEQQAAAAARQPPEDTPGSTPAATAVVEPDVLSPAESKAVAELESILGRISQLDSEGWFQAPVREADAPNYYSTIKHPMCFQVMRSKVRGKQYVSWQELVRDFELICTNAMKYNQKRSRVYKQALVILRAGKKLLIEVELEGRRAVSLLHPGPPSVAGHDSLALPSSLLAGTTGAGGSTGMTPSGGGMARTLSTLDTATTGGEGGEDAAAAAVDAPSDVERERGYSSYEETDLEDELGPDDAAAIPDLFQYSSESVLLKPWAGAAAAAAGTGGNAEAKKRQPVTKEWKRARRGIEWRARWVDLRLRELQHQRQRYQERLQAVRKQVEQQPQQQQEQQQQQGGALAAPAPVAQQPGRTWQPRSHVQQPDLQLPGLLRLPFFAEHSVVGKRRSPEEEEEALPASTAPPLAPFESDNYPAVAYAALDLMEQRLGGLRAQLLSLQKPAAQAALARPQARAPAGFGRPPARRTAGTYTPRGRPPSKSGTPREDSGRLGKRVRRAAEYTDLGEMLVPGALGAPKYVERVQHKTIDVPRVKVLPTGELKRRQAAVDAFGFRVRQGETEAAAAEAIDQLCPDEGSSDEETSDEAFALRHAAPEAEEQTRYAGFGGGQPQRSKKPSSKVGKDRSRPSNVTRTASAPAVVTAVPVAQPAQQQQVQQMQEQQQPPPPPQQQAAASQPAPAAALQQSLAAVKKAGAGHLGASASAPAGLMAAAAAAAAGGAGSQLPQLLMVPMPPQLAAQMAAMAQLAQKQGATAAQQGGPASALTMNGAAQAMMQQYLQQQRPGFMPAAAAAAMAAAASAASPGPPPTQAAAGGEGGHAALHPALQAIIPLANGPPSNQQQLPRGATKGPGRPRGSTKKPRQ